MNPEEVYNRLIWKDISKEDIYEIYLENSAEVLSVVCVWMLKNIDEEKLPGYFGQSLKAAIARESPEIVNTVLSYYADFDYADFIETLYNHRNPKIIRRLTRLMDFTFAFVHFAAKKGDREIAIEIWSIIKK